MDSCKIYKNQVFKSKYLMQGPLIEEFPRKYRKVNSKSGGETEPDYNTEIYCFIMSIINILYDNGRYSIYSKKQYFDFITYLNEMGVSQDLITVFGKIYSKDDNINPVDLLDGLKPCFNNPKVKEFKIRDKHSLK